VRSERSANKTRAQEDGKWEYKLDKERKKRKEKKHDQGTERSKKWDRKKLSED